MVDTHKIINLILRNLSDDLLKPGYKSGQHCYVASEALYHLLGGKSSGFKPMNIKHEGTQHWFLSSDNRIIDPTSYQFKTPVPYHKARGRGFLTKRPSKRAQILISRVEDRYEI